MGDWGQSELRARLAAETSAGTARCLTCGSAAVEQGSLFQRVKGRTQLRPTRGTTILEHCNLLADGLCK